MDQGGTGFSLWFFARPSALQLARMSLVVDVHTHMFANEWLALLKQHGGPTYSVAPMGPLPQVIFSDGAPFMIPLPEMFDSALFSNLTVGYRHSPDCDEPLVHRSRR